RRDVDLRGALLALLLSLFWGGNPVAIKLGLEDAPPLRLAWMRFVVGGIVIALWAWLTGRLAGFRLRRAEVRPLLVVTLLFIAQIGTMNVGTSLTSAAHSAIVLNLYAVHTVVLSHFLIPGDRLTLRKAAGVVVAYGGIVVLFVRQAAAWPARSPTRACSSPASTSSRTSGCWAVTVPRASRGFFSPSRSSAWRSRRSSPAIA